MRAATAALSCLLVTMLFAGCGSRTSQPRDEAASADSEAAAPAPAPAPAGDSALVALGNEPFWNVRVNRREIVYTVPEYQDGYRFPPATPALEGDGRVYRTRRDAPAGSPGPRAIELRVRPGACSDGMSDREYSMTATLRIDGETRAGCAFYQGDAPR